MKCMKCPMIRSPHLRAGAVVIGCLLLIGCQAGPPSGFGGFPRGQQELTGLPYANQSFPSLMAQIDADGDAAISKQEVEHYLSRRFLTFDADGDAAVTQQEFRSAEERDQVVQREKQEYLDRTFGQLDTDHDGRLTKTELLAGAEERFGRIDVNRDARLTADDYVTPDRFPRRDGTGWRGRGGFGGFGGRGRF